MLLVLLMERYCDRCLSTLADDALSDGAYLSCTEDFASDQDPGSVECDNRALQFRERLCGAPAFRR